MAGRDKSTRIVRKLRQNEERYRELFDSINVCVAVYKVKAGGADFVIKDFNTAAEKVEKVSRQEITGKSILEVFPGVKEMGLIEAMKRVWETEAPERLPDRLYREKKVKSWRDYYIYKLPSGDIVTVYEDITGRKKGQEALEEAELRYKTVADLTYNWEFWIGPDGKMLYVSPSCERISGYTPAQFIKEPKLMEKIILPEDRDIFKAHEGKARERQEDTITCRIRHKDGEIRWIEHQCRSIFDDKGAWLGIRGSNRDITARKQAEESLSESETRYRVTLEQLEEAYYESDLNGRFTFCNEAMCKLLGYTQEEMLNSYYSDYLPQEHQQPTAELLQRLYESGDFSEIGHRTLVRKDGSKIQVEGSVFPMRNAAGKITGYRGIVRDVTAREKAERELSLRAELLNSANDGIFILSGMDFVYANRTMYESLGYTKDEFMKLKLTDLDTPDYAALIPERKEEIDAKGDLIFETAYRRKDGSVVPMEVHARNIELYGKTHLLGTARDITERKRSETQVRESEEKYRLLVENANEGIVVLQDGMVKFVNRNAPKAMGTAFENIYSRPFIEFIHPDDRPVVLDRFARRLKGEKFKDMHPFRLVGTGEPLWVEGEMTSIVWEGKPATLVFLTNLSARKKAEDALRQSEERYRTILDQLNEGYYEIDLKGNLTFFNDSLPRLFEYTREELTGMNYRDYIPPEHQAERREAYNRVYRTGEPAVLYRKAHRKRDGSIVYVDVTIAPVRDAMGKITGFRGVCTNVTDKIKTEEELRLRAELLDSASDSIYVMDLGGNILYANEACYTSRGYTRDEFLSLNIHDMVAPGFADRIDLHIAEVARKKDLTFESAHLRKDGTAIPVEVHSRSIIHNGQTCLLSSARDITERKQAEEALRASEEKYRLLAENSADAIWTLDKDLNLTYMSPAIRKILGLHQNEVYQHAIQESMTPESLRRLTDTIEMYKEEIEHGTDRIVQIEIEHIRLDGTIVPVELSVRALYDSDGSHSGFIGITRDISERKKAQDLLRQSESKFSAAFMSAADPSVITEIGTGRIIEANRAWETKLGYSRAEIIGHTTAELNIWADPAQHDEIVGCLLRQGKIEDYETRMRDRNGRVYDTMFSAEIIEISNNKYILSNAHDITELKEAAEALRQSEEKYRMLAENTEDVIWTAGTDFRFTYMSPSIQKLRGFTPEEAMAQKLEETVTPESIQVLMKELERASGDLAKGLAVSAVVEAEQYCKDGSTIWTESLIRPLYDNSRKHIGYIGTTRDITKRKSAEQRSSANEAKFSSAFMLSSDPLSITNLGEGKFVEVNPAWQAWTGYSEEEALGRNTVDLNLWHDPAQRDEILEEIGRHGKVQDREIMIRIKDGSVRTTLLSAHITQIDGRQFLFTRVRDITEQKKAAMVIEQVNRQMADVLDFLPDATLAIDRDKKVILWNRAMVKMTGIEAAEMTGKGDFVYALPFYGQPRPLLMDLLWENRQELRAKYPYIIEEGDSIISEAYCPALYGGRGAWVYAKASPLHDKDGNMVGAIEAVRDITAEKQAEEIIRKSEEKYRLLAENADDCIWTLDPDLNFTYVSPAAVKLWGREPDEIMHMSVKGLITPTSMPAIIQDLIQLRKNAELGISSTQRSETEQYHKNGGTVWIESTLRSYYDSHGRLQGYIGVSRDVTKRRKVSEELRESEAKYSTLVENAGEALLVIQDSLMKFGNRKLAELIGYTSDEYTGTPFTNYIHPDDMELVTETYKARLSGKPVPGAYAFRIITKQAVERWVELHGTLIEWEGKPASMYFITDITERVLAQKALQESEEKYRLLAENIDDVIWLMDRDLHLKYVSPSIMKLRGVTPEEAMREKFDDIVTPKFREKIRRLLERNLADLDAGKAQTIRQEIEQYRKDGSVVWVELNTKTLHDSTGRLTGFQGTARDITERKAAEKALRESEERYRLVAENADDCIWRLDADFNYTYISPSIQKLRGFTPEEAMRQTLKESTTPESRAVVMKDVSEFAREAAQGRTRTSRVEIEQYRKDGTTVWIESVCRSYLGPDGRVAGYIGTSRDITQRKEAEKALHESQARYSELLENAGEAILVAQEGIVKFINHRLTELLGYTEEEFLGAPFTKFLHIDDVEWVSQRYAARMRGEPVEPNYAFRVVHKNGQVLWVEIHAALVTWEGRPAGLNFLTDITAARKAEEALKYSEVRYKLLAENTDDVIWTLDQNLGFVYFSPSIQKLLGYTPEEILQKKLEEVMTPESMKKAYQELESNLADIKAGIDRSVIMEVEQYHKDGYIVPVEINVKTLYDSERRHIGFLGTSRNLTARKAAEKALIESEQKFRDIFEQSSDAIFITDKDGNMLDANQSMCALTGYSREEILALSDTPLQHARNQFLSWIRKSGGSFKDNEYLVVRKDGTKANTLVTASARRDKDGNILGYQGIIHDITERKRLDEERQKTARIESIGTLAGGIAHDFNNILGAVIGNISMAKAELAAGHAAHELLHDAERAIIRARELTGQLLTFSKGGAPVKKVIQLTNTIVETASFAVRGSSCRCAFTIAGDLSPADVDEGQIGQVINNLVINARQAMPSGGEIAVTAENIFINEELRLGKSLPLAPGKYIRITVKDQGIGIQPEHLSKVFDPYFTTKQKGSGLGLATCYSIIKNHGGHIGVESEPGQGSTFYIYLHAAEKPAEQAKQAEKKEEARMNGRILVMDDEAPLRATISSMLKRIGFEHIVTAASGEEALEAYRDALQSKQPFDAVILDLTVPGGMGGKETMDKLLEIDPGVTAIVSSGYANEPIMADYPKYGFKGVIVKPYTFDELRNTMHHLMDSLKKNQPA